MIVLTRIPPTRYEDNKMPYTFYLQIEIKQTENSYIATGEYSRKVSFIHISKYVIFCTFSYVGVGCT